MKIGLICGKTNEKCLDKDLVKRIPKKYKSHNKIGIINSFSRQNSTSISNFSVKIKQNWYKNYKKPEFYLT